MNAQQNQYQYPPPGAQGYNYQFEYPPPPPPQPPYLAPPQPQFGVQRLGTPQQITQQQHPTSRQQQLQYFRGYQQPQPTPQRASARSARQQHNATQRDANTNASAPGPPNDGAGVQATSPELDQFDQNLMSALQTDNNEPQSQSGAQQSPNGNSNDDDPTEPIFNLPPPPENTYANEEELEKAMHAWSLEHGYELVRRASKKNASGHTYKRYYHCSKHGSKGSRIPSPQRRRNRRGPTSRIGCPMSLAAVAVDPANPEGGQWQIRHRKSHHNHAALEAVSLAGHRRRAREGNVEKAVDGLFDIGSSTTQVLTFLQKTHPAGLFTRTDVGNMKSKWRKWGTCGSRVGGGEGDEEFPRPGPGRQALLTACVRCRQKKVACGSEKPSCARCGRSGAECRYDQPAPNNQELNNASVSRQVTSLPTPTQRPPVPASANAGASNASNSNPRNSGTARPPTDQAAATRDLLASLLPTFPGDSSTRERLSLQSSSVEVLAQSSCGTGESFRSLPTLSHPNTWPQWRDAFTEAARKENCFDVLLGHKPQPSNPSQGQDGAVVEVEAEVWNEYIKQLAIYNRRNDMLLYTLRANISLHYSTRVHPYPNAAHVWSALEDLMAPQGSQTAFQLFNELHNISLSNSADLKDYIHRLTSTYEQFKQLKLNTSPLSANRRRTQHLHPTAHTGEEALTEEMVCFFFLRNLGAEWQGWVESTIATNNVGGFGTGERVGFGELGKRAEGWGRMRGLRESRAE